MRSRPRSPLVYLLIASQFVVVSATSRDPDLVGYWSFDEGTSSSELFDYSGHHHITRIHGEARSVDGILGRALEFDGQTNFVDVLDGVWNVGAPLSLLFWFKPAPLAKGQTAGTLIEREATGAVAGMIYCLADGTVSVGDSHACIVNCGLPFVRAGEWNFVVVTIATNEIRTYWGGKPVGKCALNGFPPCPGRLSIGARGSVGDSFYRGSIDEVAIYRRIISEGEIAAIFHNYEAGVAPISASGVEIIGLSTDKLLYGTGERGFARIALKNFANQHNKVSLAVKLISLLGKETSISRGPIDLSAGEVRILETPLNLAGHSMGCEVMAQVGEDDDVGFAREYFSISDNLWEVGIGGPFSPGQDCQKSPLQLERELEDVRRGYANWVEVFFWAPDDWGCLAPEKDHWWSGQSNYLVRKNSLMSLISQAHRHGIKVITYGKNMACGPEGWELARRHPDWFMHDPSGHVQGVGIPFMLDNWNNEPLRRSGTFAPGWQRVTPDLRNREALDWGIEQIVRSIREFGWDGIRFDDHFTAGDDEWTTFNTRRMKERLWRDHPGFLFGYNYGISPDTTGHLDHEQREAMAEGGMWLQEAISHWRYGAGLTYTNWSDYVKNEMRAAKQVQAVGGSYHGIYGLGSNPVQDVYKLIYALISGGHSVYGSHARIAGCDNWGQFMTRWSAFLWDRRLRIVEHPESQVTVRSSAKVDAFVEELIESARRRFLVVHLVNPPPEQSIAQTTNFPPPVASLTLGFPNLRKPKRIVLVRPETKPFDRNLSPSQRNRGYEVTISNLNCWAMIVLEVDGNFSTLDPPPKFSEPPNPNPPPVAMSDVDTPRKEFNPLWRNKNDFNANQQIFETDSPAQNVNAEVVSDPEASGGLAQRKDWRAPVYMGRSWLGPFTPGRYSVSYRVKWVEERPATEVASIVITEQTTGRKLAGRDITVFDPNVALPTPRKYQYHSIGITLTNTGYIQCLLVTSRNRQWSPDLIFLDHIRVERLESFGDERLDPPLPQFPPDLSPPKGDHPEKVLLVKGLYWQQYGIEKALACAGDYAIPTEPRELYGFDAVILCNIDLTFVDPAVRRLYREYARAGGRIIFLGGPDALNLGGLQRTFLEELLPVNIEEATSHLDQRPLPLGDKLGAPFPDRPFVFWSHPLNARPDAEILAFAGDRPILLRRRTGRGQVIVFAGTVLGEGSENEPPFWECPTWMKLVRRMVLE